jgi:prephenate dehydrogenase
MSENNAVRLKCQVRVVGAGLLGASIGLRLASQGVDVILAGSSPTTLKLAVDLGAGRLASATDLPKLIVVCVPPDVTADVIAAELAAFPDAVVTDVASVKLEPFEELVSRKVDLTRYIGSHPLAGREKGGAISAQGDLFVGRPWVICRDEETPSWALSLVEDLAADLGSIVIEMTPQAHDASVALVSHVPQVVSSLLAKQLEKASDDAVRLAGQGVRDTTRIAASSPELWIQILSANSDNVVRILEDFRADVDKMIVALRDVDAQGARTTIMSELAGGNAGVSRLPGKHGQNKKFASVTVLVDDKPGQIARLLTEIGELGVNLEDLRLEHVEGAALGLVEFTVLPEAAPGLIAELETRNWSVHR